MPSLTDHPLRFFPYGLAAIAVTSVGLIVCALVSVSFHGDIAFSYSLLGLMLFYPLAFTEPGIATEVLLTVTAVQYFGLAYVVTSVVRHTSSARLILLIVLAALISGLAAEQVLAAMGYTPRHIIMEF